MSQTNPSAAFSLDFLRQAAKAKHVSAGELKALEIALKKNGSQDVASELGITNAAVRKRLGEVYKKFEIPGKGPGKLTSLKALLQSQANEYATKPASHSAELPPRRGYTHGESLKSLSGLTTAPDNSEQDAPTQSNPAQNIPEQSNPAQNDPESTFAAAGYLSHAASTPIAPTLNSALGLNAFYGRSHELASIADWVSAGSGRKLLAICGMGGIGKTAFAAQLVREVKHCFEKVVWLSIEKKGKEKQLDVLLKEAISKLHGSASALTPDTPTDALVDQFINYLDRHRCLVVIDGLDQVFTSYSDQPHRSNAQSDQVPTFDVRRRQQASAYKPGFEAYFELLSSIQTQSFQNELISGKGSKETKTDAGVSCVVVTSREKPREMFAIAQDSTTARLQTLDGLRDDEAQDLLNSFYLTGEPSDYHQLITRYYGHPMALRLASSTIKDAFFGKIRDFLEQEISVFDDLRSVIKTQFRRLSPSEQEVMYWLAINRAPCTIENLQNDIVANAHKHNVLYTLNSLQRRFLIEVEQIAGTTSYRMHPIVADYVLNRFIRSVFLELARGDIGGSFFRGSLFNSHALMKADTDDDLREFQCQQIVRPILERLNNYCKSLIQTDKLLSRRLEAFRESNARRLGYAGGNFVNLLVQLSEGQVLHEKDFSQMTIWQAYLQGVQLRNVNFNSCELDRSVFTETLSDVMAVACTAVAAHPPSSSEPSVPLMAAGDANGKIHLWPTKSPAQKCAEWVAHGGWVRAIAFVPGQPSNQQLLVTGGDDNRLRLWQVPNSTRQGDLQSLNYPTQLWQKEALDWVHAVAVSPDGKIIASGGNNNITLYHVSDGEQLHAFTDNNSSPENKKLENKKPENKNCIRALAFSPDGQWLASCGDDSIVKVWSVAALQTPGNETDRRLRFEGHTGLVHTLCFSMDSKLLVSGGADRCLYVWTLENGERKARFERSSDRIRSIAIANNGLLASGGDDCQIRLWDIHSQSYIKDISTGQSRIWSVAFQQQGNRLLLLAGGDKQALMLWDVMGWDAIQQNAIQQTDRQQISNQPTNLQSTNLKMRPIRTYRGYTNGIRSVAFLSEQRIIGGGDSGEILVWDKETGDRTTTLPFHHGRIWSLAVDLEHARIASASDDHSIRLWDAKTGQCLTTLTGHNNWVRSIAFSRHGRFLVSAGDDCSIRIWNTASGFCRRNINKFEAWIRSAAFAPHNSRYVITGGDDEVVKRWDIKDEYAISLAKHEHRICSVTYSPDGRLIASGSDDATVIVWDVEKEDKVYHFKDADLGIKSVAFSPNGRYLAGGGEDQLVYIWDLAADNPEQTCLELRPQDYQGLSGGIRSVAFSADSRYVISGGLDEMIRIGDLQAVNLQMGDLQMGDLQMGDLQTMDPELTQVMRPLIVRDRPYENIEIENVQGLSELQVANLMTLGAVNKAQSLLN
ncbi:MAG: NB-ARC domain-containing protein [Cyanobacteria bacterium P01_D01_bin.105]